jgi:hypothetical protein
MSTCRRAAIHPNVGLHVGDVQAGLLLNHALTKTWDGARFTRGLKFLFCGRSGQNGFTCWLTTSTCHGDGISQSGWLRLVGKMEKQRPRNHALLVALLNTPDILKRLYSTPDRSNYCLVSHLRA